MTGWIYGLSFVPFNHRLHWTLFLIPMTMFVVFVPIFSIAIQKSFKRSCLHLYLFGISASLFQFYWVGNVVAEGIQVLIFAGLFLLVLYFALYFLLAGVLFRFCFKRLPGPLLIIIYPSLWILIEFIRGSGETGFPWNFQGYSFIQFLPFAQLASVTGVFGLSWIAVAFNVIIWLWVYAVWKRKNSAAERLMILISAIFFISVCLWGFIRLRQNDNESCEKLTAACLQSNIDQAHWGTGSLDTAMDITESMIYSEKSRKSDLIVLPESALFCYMLREYNIKKQVMGWADSVDIPLILGSLQWDLERRGNQRYSVYNGAFLVDARIKGYFDPYYKMKLLPFSETMPFKTSLPILNRLNLGSSDFSAGREPVVFDIRGKAKAAPLICYEVLFTSVVRERIKRGADVLVNITNDGWFGRSSAPFQHAEMAKMRCIENGVSMIRCANSGISMFVDQFGRGLGSTGLYERTILTGEVPLKKYSTFYTRAGDWPLLVSSVIAAAFAGWLLFLRIRKRSWS